MGIATGTILEVRQDGSDLNGGGFNPNQVAVGTDFSQQAAPKASGSDLTVDSVTNTKVTSASYTFDASDVGNLMQLQTATGWSATFYEVVAVSAGAATLDHSPAAVNVTGGIWRLGGAFASPGMIKKMPASKIMAWIRGGNYVISTSTTGPLGPVAINPGGAIDNPNRITGYGTVRGDNGPFPVITATVGSVTMFATTSSDICQISNLIVDGGGFNTNGCFSLGSGGRVYNCVGRNSGGNFSSSGSSGGAMINCSSEGALSNGFFVVGEAINCVSKGGISNGFSMSGNGRAIRCLAISNASYGFTSTGGGMYTAVECTAYGNANSGFQNNGSNTACFYRCLAYQNGGYGFDNSSNPASKSTFAIQCAAGANTSGDIIAGSLVNALGFVSLTANPFIDAPGGNFALNNVVGGGASLRNISQTLPNISTTYYGDIGAVQHPNPPAGSISLF